MDETTRVAYHQLVDHGYVILKGTELEKVIREHRLMVNVNRSEFCDGMACDWSPERDKWDGVTYEDHLIAAILAAVESQ